MAVDLLYKLSLKSAYGSSDEAIVMLERRSTDGFFSQLRGNLITQIDGINTNMQKVYTLCDAHKHASTQDENNKIMNEMEDIITNNSNICCSVRNTINKEKDNIIRTERSVTNLKVIEFNNLIKRFQKSSQDFQTSLNAFDKSVRDKQMRQIQILIPTQILDGNDIQTLFNADYEYRHNFISNKVLLTGASDKILNRLEASRNQRDGMLKVAQASKELYALYNQLNLLVVDQQMLIDRIQEQIIGTKDKVETGTKMLENAEKQQKRVRKMKCLCFLFVLFIVLVIAGYIVPWNKLF